MSDLISREAILKHIEKTRQAAQMMDDTRRASILMNGMYLCEKAVRNQPSAQTEQRWIPVSERLPDEKEIVLITFDERVEMGRMCGESWEWLFESGWDYWIDIDNVTAWMPLPDPYKEES